MTRILIVDDHIIVREGVVRLLSELLQPPLEFDEAENGQEAINLILHNDYDLVLLDISMPGRDGLDVLKQMRLLKPRLQVVMLTMHPEEQYAVRAFQTGAAGYLSKGSRPQQLKDALEKVLRGGRYVSGPQGELLAEAVGTPQEGEQLHKLLSNRELQFVKLMVSGMTLTEIARELSVSSKTVSTYRLRVLEKLRLRSNAEIINYWIRHNL